MWPQQCDMICVAVSSLAGPSGDWVMVKSSVNLMSEEHNVITGLCLPARILKLARLVFSWPSFRAVTEGILTCAAVRASLESFPASQIRQYCASLSTASGLTCCIRHFKHTPTASRQLLLASPVRRCTRGKKKTWLQEVTSSSGNLLMIICSKLTSVRLVTCRLCGYDSESLHCADDKS